MDNGIRKSESHGLNKGCGLKFHEGSWVWQTPEEGLRTYWPKHCEYNNKDEDNSRKTLNDKNQQTLSKKIQTTNTLGENINSLIPPAIDKIVLYKNGFGIKNPQRLILLNNLHINLIITTVQSIYKCRYKYTGGLCCFRYKRLINFLTSVLRHEERDTILTMLTILCWLSPTRGTFCGV